MDFAAESIVRDLAAIEPLVDTEGGGMYPGPECGTCSAFSPNEVTDHHPTCVWRRAREWVDANPPRHTPGYQL